MTADPRSERERREGDAWAHLMRLHVEIAALEQAMTEYREGRGPLPEVPEFVFVGPPERSNSKSWPPNDNLLDISPGLRDRMNDQAAYDPAFPEGEPPRRFPPRLLKRMSSQVVFDQAQFERFRAEHGGKTPGDLVEEECDRLTAHEVHARLSARTRPIQEWEIEAARQRALDTFDDRKRRDGLIELVLMLERCDWPQGEAWRARLIELLEVIGPLRGHLTGAKRGE